MWWVRLILTMLVIVLLAIVLLGVRYKDQELVVAGSFAIVVWLSLGRYVWSKGKR